MVLFETLWFTFPFNWNSIALASWLKYPNHKRPDILGLDLWDRYYDHETGTLTTYRVSLLQGMMPSWVCSITGGCVCLFLEKCVVNPRERVMQLVSSNVTCNQFLELQEVCTYTVDPQNAQQTLFRQDMKIQAHVWGVGGQIERIGADNFKRTAVGGREVMMNAVRLIPKAITGAIFDPKVEHDTLVDTKL